MIILSENNSNKNVDQNFVDYHYYIIDSETG